MPKSGQIRLFRRFISEPDEVEDATLAAMIQVCIEDEEHAKKWAKGYPC